MLGLQDSMITFAREGGKDVLRGDDGLGVSRGGRQCEIISFGWRSRSCGFGCGCGCGRGFRPHHHHRHSPPPPHHHALTTLRASCRPWSLRQMRGNRAGGRQTPHHGYKFPPPPSQDPPTNSHLQIHATQHLAADSTEWILHRLRREKAEKTKQPKSEIEMQEAMQWLYYALNGRNGRIKARNVSLELLGSRSREDNVGHSRQRSESITNAMAENVHPRYIWRLPVVNRGSLFTDQVVGDILDVFMWMRKGYTDMIYVSFIYDKLSWRIVSLISYQLRTPEPP